MLDRASFTAGVKWEDEVERQVYRVGGQVLRNSYSAFTCTGKIPLNDDSCAVVQWGGNYPGLKNRFRVEWNPSKESYRFQQFISSLNLFTNRLEPFNVTRMDFAVDYRLPLRALEVEYKAGVSRQYHTGRNGELETLYCGSRSSDYRLRLYDKAVEQGVSGIDWSRLEAQMRGRWNPGQLQKVGVQCFPGVKLYNNLGQLDIKSEQIPVEYKALLHYLELYPWEEGKLGRVKRQKVKGYREIQKKEIDIHSVVRRDMPGLLKGFTKKLGFISEVVE